MKRRPATLLPATIAAAPPAAAALATLTLAAACTDARPHDALMTDAHADVEAIHLERAMHRFDSARTAKPDDAEAHARYAALAAYFELNATAAEAWERVLELEPGTPRRGTGTSNPCTGPAHTSRIDGTRRR